MNQATRTVTDWLASAHPVPAQARREFDAGIALVALGQSSPRQMPMTRERTP